MGWRYNPQAWKELREKRGYTMKQCSQAIYDSPHRELWAGIESCAHTPSMKKLCASLEFLNAGKNFLKELIVLEDEE